jgi:hypothetical protein
MSKPNVFQIMMINRNGKPINKKARQVLNAIYDKRSYLECNMYYLKYNCWGHE